MAFLLIYLLFAQVFNEKRLKVGDQTIEVSKNPGIENARSVSGTIEDVCSAEDLCCYGGMGRGTSTYYVNINVEGIAVASENSFGADIITPYIDGMAWTFCVDPEGKSNSLVDEAVYPVECIFPNIGDSGSTAEPDTELYRMKSYNLTDDPFESSFWSAREHSEEGHGGCKQQVNSFRFYMNNDAISYYGLFKKETKGDLNIIHTKISPCLYTYSQGGLLDMWCGSLFDFEFKYKLNVGDGRIEWMVPSSKSFLVSSDGYPYVISKSLVDEGVQMDDISMLPSHNDHANFQFLSLESHLWRESETIFKMTYTGGLNLRNVNFVVGEFKSNIMVKPIGEGEKKYPMQTEEVYHFEWNGVGEDVEIPGTAVCSTSLGDITDNYAPITHGSVVYNLLYFPNLKKGDAIFTRVEPPVLSYVKIGDEGNTIPLEKEYAFEMKNVTSDTKLMSMIDKKANCDLNLCQLFQIIIKNGFPLMKGCKIKTSQHVEVAFVGLSGGRRGDEEIIIKEEKFTISRVGRNEDEDESLFCCEGESNVMMRVRVVVWSVIGGLLACCFGCLFFVALSLGIIFCVIGILKKRKKRLEELHDEDLVEDGDFESSEGGSIK